MKINYLLGLPTFLMIIGLAWASHSHASWDNSYEESDLPEVRSLLGPEDSSRSSFELGAPKKGSKPSKEQAIVLELVNQLDSIQRDLQELRGQLEVQSHELKTLKDQALAANPKSVVPVSIPSANTNSGLELNSSGITYKPEVK